MFWISNNVCVIRRLQRKTLLALPPSYPVRRQNPVLNSEPHLGLIVLEVHVVLVSVLVGEGDQGNDLRPHQRPLSQHLCHHLTTVVWHDVSEGETGRRIRPNPKQSQTDQLSTQTISCFFPQTTSMTSHLETIPNSTVAYKRGKSSFHCSFYLSLSSEQSSVFFLFNITLLSPPC